LFLGGPYLQAVFLGLKNSGKDKKRRFCGTGYLELLTSKFQPEKLGFNIFISGRLKLMRVFARVSNILPIASDKQYTEKK